MLGFIFATREDKCKFIGIRPSDSIAGIERLERFELRNPEMTPYLVKDF